MVANRTKAAARRSPSNERRNRASCSAVHVVCSCFDGTGGFAAAAALRTTSPSRSASAKALRRTTWTPRTVFGLSGRPWRPARCQKLLVQVLDLERHEGLERHGADPALDVCNRLAVAVPARRSQPGLHDLEPLVEVIADRRRRPLDVPAGIDRRRQLPQRGLGGLAGAIAALRRLPAPTRHGVGPNVEHDRPRRPRFRTDPRAMRRRLRDRAQLCEQFVSIGRFRPDTPRGPTQKPS